MPSAENSLCRQQCHLQGEWGAALAIPSIVPLVCQVAASTRIGGKRTLQAQVACPARAATVAHPRAVVYSGWHYTLAAGGDAHVFIF